MAKDENGHDNNVTPFIPRDDTERVDELDDLFDFEDDAFLAEWAEMDEDAVVVLREALPELREVDPPADELRTAAELIRAGVTAGKEPYAYIPGGAGWGPKLPDDDEELWISASGSLIAGIDETPMSIQRQSTIMALQHGDWAAAVIGLVRAGVGAPAEPHDLVRYAGECPEIEGEAEPDDIEIIEEGFTYVLELWEATGAVDGQGRFTELGHWGLPRALAWAWKGDFDAAGD